MILEQNIYIVIFICILLVLASNFFIEYDILTKQKIAIAIFVAILLLIIINYYLNYDYIERFKVIEKFSTEIVQRDIIFYSGINLGGNIIARIPYGGSSIDMNGTIINYSGGTFKNIKSIKLQDNVGLRIYSTKSDGINTLFLDFNNKSTYRLNEQNILYINNLKNSNGTDIIWTSFPEIAVQIYPISSLTPPIQSTTPSTTPSTTVPTLTIACENLGSDSNKQTFAENQITIFIEYLKEIFVSYHIYLTTLDSTDLFRRISGSMRGEHKTFKEHREIYKYKNMINDKTIDIMKHEMIVKTAIVTMITLMFLIITAVYLAFTYKPEFIKAYLIIAGIFGILNIYIFIKAIIQPTRTKARNNYWYKIADSIAMSMF